MERLMGGLSLGTMERFVALQHAFGGDRGQLVALAVRWFCFHHSQPIRVARGIARSAARQGAHAL